MLHISSCLMEMRNCWDWSFSRCTRRWGDWTSCSQKSNRSYSCNNDRTVWLRWSRALLTHIYAPDNKQITHTERCDDIQSRRLWKLLLICCLLHVFCCCYCLSLHSYTLNVFWMEATVHRTRFTHWGLDWSQRFTERAPPSTTFQITAALLERLDWPEDTLTQFIWGRRRFRLSFEKQVNTCTTTTASFRDISYII